jgi:hypothetical protein
MRFKTFRHFKTIIKHKYWVGKYCFMCGIPWQGITHDLSKFSPTEFIESIKYYQGTTSPIDAAKKDKGYSRAWLHHKGRNRHHYEYWQDNFDKGGESLVMPYEYAVELLCDYLGAARTYMGKKFNYKSEYQWWKNKIENPIAMHPAIMSFIDYMLFLLSTCKDDKEAKIFLNKYYCYSVYKMMLNDYRSYYVHIIGGIL